MFDFLKKVPLFANLSEADLERLVVSEETISAGELLFSQGEIGNKAYVITSGEVEILKESGEQTILLATCGAGEEPVGPGK